MRYVIFEKAKKIYVPPSGRKKGYYRTDPREKHEEGKVSKLLEALRYVLEQIGVYKKAGGFITPEQRKHIHKTLKQIEVKAKHFKQQKQRQEVFKVMKQVRAELKVKGQPEPKKKKNLSQEIISGIKQLGYSDAEINRMGEHEAKAVYYNDIKK